MQLSDDQQKAIEHARRAMAQGLEISVGPKLALPLAVIAISGAFADVVSASASRSGSALVDVINSQLEAVWPSIGRGRCLTTSPSYQNATSAPSSFSVLR